ncbi:hypothetical protein Naga_100010g7 [Nannochloropsis gaditana]|uniref:Uncharacterized protein n=1 Tax=Nannochloropsis gaditana TaxID=72520 RepID=W7TMD2_9STRA|nr:hypothetical protein Naga_100010g7 [Nannochloropsis gaditana]
MTGPTYVKTGLHGNFRTRNRVSPSDPSLPCLRRYTHSSGRVSLIGGHRLFCPLSSEGTGWRISKGAIAFRARSAGLARSSG